MMMMIVLDVTNTVFDRLAAVPTEYGSASWTDES